MARGVTFIPTAIQVTPWMVQRNIEKLERTILSSGGAGMNGILDVAGYYTSTTVEDALAEVWLEASSSTSDTFTDTNGYYTVDQVGPSFDALGVQLGGLTSTTFTFTGNTVVPNDTFVYPALDLLDQEWGKLANTNTASEGANLVGIQDAGTLIVATTVEGALAENRTALNLNTTHRSSDGSDHSFLDQSVINGAAPIFAVTNFTGSAAGIDSDSAAHIASTGADHSFLDQNVISGAAPIFAVTNFTGSAAGIDSDSTTHIASDGSSHSLVAAMGVPETGDTLQAKRVAKAVWDHGAGLAAASSPFTFGPTLPDNAVVTRVWYQVVTQFTSATDAAVLGIGIVTDDSNGLVTPVAISAGTDWDPGNNEGIQDGTVVNFAVQTTAARLFEGTLTTEDTTGGKVIVFAEYVVTE